MKIRNIYNQITAPTIQDLWLYKGDLRYFGNRGWQSLFPDYSKNFEEINTQIDTINKQLDAIESTTASINYDSNTKKIQLLSNGSVISEIDATVFIKDGMVSNVTIDNDTKIVTITFNTDAGKEDIEVDFSDIYDVLSDKIGSTTFTDANYISKELNLTDAALQLDEEIKATNDNLAILNAASIKGVKVGNNTTNETVENGIVTIAPADVYKDGAMTSTLMNNLNSGYTQTILCEQGENGDMGLRYYNRNPVAGAGQTAKYTKLSKASRTASGIMDYTDKIKLDSIINTGDGTKFLADNFTYKTIQMPDLSTYATKTELSGYLPLSGGEMTGPININGDFSIDSSGSTVVFDGAHYLQFIYGTDEVTVIRLGNSSINVGWCAGGTGDLILEGDTIYRYSASGDECTIYDSGNFIAGTNYVAPSTLNNYLPLSGGTLTGILKVPYTGIQTDGGNSIIFFNSSELFIGNSNFRGIWETTNQDLIHRRVDTNYTIIDTYNTFNTITYTTSASEDNLRAWNNYVNGYVTNLRIVDNALTSYTRVVNGVDIENKKFNVYIIGGDPVRLVRAEYILADNGSVTVSRDAYTLTPVTV